LLERQAQVRGKVLSALAYPIVLSFVAAFVVFALMIYVVPKVVEQFQDVGQELPLLTRVVIGLSNFPGNWWWALLAGLLLMVFMFSRALREENLRLGFDRFLLRPALAGAAAARPARGAAGADALSTMVASRLPALEGLRLTTQTVHNRVLRKASADIRRVGADRRQPVRRAEAGGVFPPLLVYLNRERGGFGPARHDAGAGGRLSGAGVRHLHRDGAGAAGAGDHHHHGRGGGADRSVDPAADPSTRHNGR
jgi:general secretion pathway protein F